MIDFLVIGGGIAGTSAAAALSALGQVTLLEGESALGYHASGRSAALYEANYGKPSTVALNRASLAYHQDADVLSPRGLLLVGSRHKGTSHRHPPRSRRLDRHGGQRRLQRAANRQRRRRMGGPDRDNGGRRTDWVATPAAIHGAHPRTWRT